MDKIIKRLLLLAVMCTAPSVYAQAPTAFSGKVEAVKFNNIDENTQNYSSGIGYNGTEEVEYIISGEKTLLNNKSLHYTTLFDPAANVVAVWCEGLGKGLSIDYSDYTNMMGVFMREPRTLMNITLPPYSVYEISTVARPADVLGYPAAFKRGRLENQYAGTSIEVETVESLSIPASARIAMCSGLDVDGLVTKFRWTIDNRAGAAGQFKGYQGLEATAIIPDGNIDTSTFTIPKKIKMTKAGADKLDAFYKEIGKYLRKNKLFPGEGAQEVTYELNEDDWSY